MPHNKKLIALILITLMTFAASPFVLAVSVSSSSIYALFYLDKQEAFVNNQKFDLDAPVTIINNNTYVPAKFLGDLLGAKVEWNDATKKVQMLTPKAYIDFDLVNKDVTVNGTIVPFDSVSTIRNDTLLVKLTWLSNFIGFKYNYNAELRRIEVTYIKTPKSAYTDSMFYNDMIPNSRPIAKFTFGKETYKKGEPVEYIDLSYDPDTDGLTNYEWTGNKETFFEAGTFPVTLKVTDQKGTISNEYTRNITIEDKTFLDPIPYQIHNNPVGSLIKTRWEDLYTYFFDLPKLPNTVRHDLNRKLIVSDSPETFTQRGILYQEKVDGKARLYADHVNGMREKVKFAILASNANNQDATIRITNQGEVFPSTDANLIGNDGSVDFLLKDKIKSEILSVPAGKTIFFKQMPDFYPEQGMNVIYDVETSGEVTFSFVTMEPNEDAEAINKYKVLSFTGNVRGTFPASDTLWYSEGPIKKPTLLVVGDNETDVFLKGFDKFRNQEVTNEGNYGVVHHIKINHPGRVAVLLLARGGVYKGPFKINEKLILAPFSGVITAFDGVQVLARTKGNEETLDIEFTPPAGSAFPIDLIFYPLEDGK